jgi:hypothetical protein
MKLRILGNSLRLRISRSELERLRTDGSIEDSIRFAPAPEASLTYALAVEPGESGVTVRYAPQRVTVVLSKAQLQAWSQPEEVGIYVSVSNGSETGLRLTIEKDFACLDRSHAGNADAFPNPHAGRVC